MSAKILEVHPKELNFIFELKKQSSCLVKLTNRTKHDIAFKVKTTSPKKYCVRPNVGIIAPKSTFEFTVTMQAQKVAPPDMVCKDKFLIQSMVVPVGTTERDITTSMFSKDDGKHVEQIKLRVALVSPPGSPVLSPINGVLKQGPIFEDLPVKDPGFRKVQVDSFSQKFSREWESGLLNDQKLKKVKDKPEKDVNDQKWEFFNDHQFNNVKDMELKPEKKIDRQESQAPRDAELAPVKVAVSSQESPAPRDGEFVPNKGSVSSQESAGPGDAKFAQIKDVVSSQDSTAPRAEGFIPVKNVISSWGSQPTNVKESSPNKTVVNCKESETEKDKDLKPEEDAIHDDQRKPDKKAVLPPAKDVDFMKVKAVEEIKLVSDMEEMKTKLNALESKLNEAEFTISKLTEERRLSTHERNMLQGELAVLRRSTSMKKVQAGFPLLFVVMVALIGTVLGRLSRS